MFKKFICVCVILGVLICSISCTHPTDSTPTTSPTLTSSPTEETSLPTEEDIPEVAVFHYDCWSELEQKYVNKSVYVSNKDMIASIYRVYKEVNAKKVVDYSPENGNIRYLWGSVEFGKDKDITIMFECTPSGDFDSFYFLSAGYGEPYYPTEEWSWFYNKLINLKK